MTVEQIRKAIIEKYNEVMSTVPADLQDDPEKLYFQATFEVLIVEGSMDEMLENLIPMLEDNEELLSTVTRTVIVQTSALSHFLYTGGGIPEELEGFTDVQRILNKVQTYKEVS